MKSKFKVGDIVQLTRSSYAIPRGHTDVISAIHGNDVKLTAPDYTVELDALVLVEDETRLSLSRPMESIRKSTAETLCGLSAKPQPQPTAKLSLINTTKLLTSIKLD